MQADRYARAEEEREEVEVDGEKRQTNRLTGAKARDRLFRTLENFRTELSRKAYYKLSIMWYLYNQFQLYYY